MKRGGFLGMRLARRARKLVVFNWGGGGGGKGSGGGFGLGVKLAKKRARGGRRGGGVELLLERGAGGGGRVLLGVLALKSPRFNAAVGTLLLRTSPCRSRIPS